MSKITCNKCYTEVVKNSALGKSFYYCRKCKQEVINEMNNGFHIHMELNGITDPCEVDLDTRYSNTYDIYEVQLKALKESIGWIK